MKLVLLLIILAVTMTLVCSQRTNRPRSQGRRGVVVACSDEQTAGCENKCKSRNRAVKSLICIQKTRRDEVKTSKVKCRCAKRARKSGNSSEASNSKETVTTVPTV